MAVRENITHDLKLNEIQELLNNSSFSIVNKLNKPKAGDVYICHDDKEGKKC